MKNERKFFKIFQLIHIDKFFSISSPLELFFYAYFKLL